MVTGALGFVGTASTALLEKLDLWPIAKLDPIWLLLGFMLFFLLGALGLLLSYGMEAKRLGGDLREVLSAWPKFKVECRPPHQFKMENSEKIISGVSIAVTNDPNFWGDGSTGRDIIGKADYYGANMKMLYGGINARWSDEDQPPAVHPHKSTKRLERTTIVPGDTVTLELLAQGERDPNVYVSDIENFRCRHMAPHRVIPYADEQRIGIRVRFIGERVLANEFWFVARNHGADEGTTLERITGDSERDEVARRLAPDTPADPNQ